MLYSLESEAEHIVKTFVCANAVDENNYDVIMDKLDTYFRPKVNVIHKRARFHQRGQKTGESVKEYVRNLHELAEKCLF